MKKWLAMVGSRMRTDGVQLAAVKRQRHTISYRCVQGGTQSTASQGTPSAMGRAGQPSRTIWRVTGWSIRPAMCSM